MRLIRNLDTTLKIHACLAIVLFLGVALAAWLLAQLGQLSELTAQVLQRGGAVAGGAQAAELLRSGYSETRNWSIAFFVTGLAVAGTLAAWLAAEVSRPVHAAMVAAKRIASGDLGTQLADKAGNTMNEGRHRRRRRRGQDLIANNPGKPIVAGEEPARRPRPVQVASAPVLRNPAAAKRAATKPATGWEEF